MDAQVQVRQQQSSQLNSAIQHVNSVRRSLSQNASEVKSQIHASISRHLEALRNREVWLLNQVDLLVNVKDDVLQRQQARLNQQLGIIQSCLAYSEENEMKHMEEFSPFQVSDLKPEETPLIRFKADPSTLRESIVNYGKIDGNGVMHPQSAFVDHKNPSTSLPRAFEDYDDGDPMMSYKTVQTDVHVFNKPIKMKIPKLSTRPEDWLANSADTMTTFTKTSPRFSFPHVSLKNSDWLMTNREAQLKSLPKSSTDSSIQNWLRQIKRNPVSEEEDFEIVASSSVPDSESGDSVEWLNTDISPELLNIKESTSDEWLKDPIPFANDFQPPKSFVEYFKEISTDLNRWLLSYSECKDKSNLGYDGKVNNGAPGVNNAVKLSETPRIDMSRFLGDISEEKYKWLDERYHSNVETLSHINNVCKTGKPCQGKIEDNTKSKSSSLIEEKSAPKAGQPPVYLAGLQRYMKNDLSGWLHQQPDSVQSTTNYSNAMFKIFTGPLFSKQWLKDPEIKCSPQIPEFEGVIRHGNDNRVWLKHDESLSLPSPTSSSQYTTKGIHSFSEMSGNDQWLSKEMSEISFD